MKANGEIMAIGRNLEESLLKGVRSLEIGNGDLYLPNISSVPTKDLIHRIQLADDERVFVIAELFRRHVTVEVIYEITKIDRLFLNKMKHIIDLESELKKKQLDLEMLKTVKQFGFSDMQIARIWNMTEKEVYDLRMQENILPVYKMVDTCAAQFESTAPYFYSTYEQENESNVTERKKVLVLGSGPIRIGQGIEFDYATVHSVLAIKEMGYEAIIMNNNPETVSTDFSISDKLYFEPLTLEDVMHVVELEKPLGVIVQFGGQTGIDLASGLEKRGVKILGTSLSAIDRAEDRNQFEGLLEELDLSRPKGKAVSDKSLVIPTAKEIGYPVLVRPSYVIGGSQMEIVHDEEELARYLNKTPVISKDKPLLVDEYIIGVEVDIDAVSDGETTVVAGIMEHIERAGRSEERRVGK